MVENICAFSPFFPADIAILGMDIDVQTIEDNVISLEMLFKTWLHDYGTEREHLHLLLPSGGFSHDTAPKTTLSISFSLSPLQGAPKFHSLKNYPGLFYEHVPSHLETQVISLGDLESCLEFLRSQAERGHLLRLLLGCCHVLWLLMLQFISILQHKCALKNMCIYSHLVKVKGPLPAESQGPSGSVV